MNKKGFISMTLVYTFLVLFLFLMLGVLNAYAHKNKFLEAINDKIDLRFTTPDNYGNPILKAMMDRSIAVESGVIDYSKTSYGEYYTASGTQRDTTAMTNGLYYTEVVEDEDNNKVHMTEDDKIVYFYRGIENDNFIRLGNMCFRILRSNEDESIRIAYYGYYGKMKEGYYGCQMDIEGLPKASYNTTSIDNRYVGYMFGTDNTTYALTHTNTNSSDIKKALDKWYEDNIKGTNYEKYIDDQVFCNERKVGKGGVLETITYTEYGFQSNNTIYASLRRNGTGGDTGRTISMSVAEPIFKCEQDNDKFTKSSSKGNKSLTYPIGTLTADEFIVAGSTFQIDNPAYFLSYGVDFWTMTPSTFTNGTAKAISVTSTGRLIESDVTETHYILPVLSLKNTTLVDDSPYNNGNLNSPFYVKED